MRTLARFEFALGRRVAWGCDGHQIHVAPHAFAEPNAFYSREHRGIFFGYFTGASGKPVYTCLSHDVVAHETTHAILDGLRARFLEPSSPDQAAFHEAFADVVALLSVFSLPGIVGAMLDRSAGGAKLIDEKHLTRDALLNSALFGLAEQMGGEISGARGQALRRSVKLERGVPYQDMEEFQEEHRRGELLVAAFLNGLVDIWLARLEKIGSITRGKRDRSIVVEEAARVAEHLLTMAIRAIDYCPPTDLTFSDYLSALLTIDREVVPDDTKYGYRKSLLENFAGFGIRPAHGAGEDGAWQRNDRRFVYTRTHFDSMLRDKEEMFRFLWENRRALEIDEIGYLEVQSVRPSIRIGPDGFVLRETVAEYVHIVTMKAEELETELGIVPPHEIPRWRRLRVFGGGALLFDEYGQLKYHIANHIRRSAEDRRRQTRRTRASVRGRFLRSGGGRGIQVLGASPRACNELRSFAMASIPARLTIRSYQVGFGDCFLLSFRYHDASERHVLIDFGSTGLPEGAPATRMMDIAKDIAARTQGKLHAVVATHRHKDHISGFATKTNGRGTGDLIASLKPDIVVQPWTEDPALDPNATGPVPGGAAPSGRALHRVKTLGLMQAVAAQALREAKRSRSFEKAVAAQLAFLGEDNLANLSAVKNLMSMAPNRYVNFGSDSGLEPVLPGVKVRVLGPPTVDQSDTIRKQRSRDPDEFWQFQATFWQFQADATRVAQGRSQRKPALFPRYVASSGPDFPIDARWLVYHARLIRGEQLLQIVRMLDDAMNNTSVILLLEVGDKRLLFPGDAQIENWAFALSKNEIRSLLATVTVYKVGHHGSLNATPKTLWNLFANRSKVEFPTRLISLMSTLEDKHGSEASNTEVPRRTLVTALAAESSHFSTQELVDPSTFFHDTVLDFPP